MDLLMRRLPVRNFLCTTFVQLKSLCSLKKVSFLYLPGHKASQVYSAVDPYLDFSNRFKNLTKLSSDLSRRGFEVDLEKFVESWFKLVELWNKRESLEKLRRSKSDDIVKGLLSDQHEIDKQKNEIRLIRETLKDLNNKIWRLEETTVICALQLPNEISEDTPVVETTLHTSGCKPEFRFKPRSHVEIAQLHSQIAENPSTHTFYLKDQLALLELALSDYFLQHLQKNGYHLHSNPDFAKSVVLEGCGYNSACTSVPLEPHPSDLDMHVTYLTGSASLASQVLYFLKGKVEDNMPVQYKVASVGRQYISIQNSITTNFSSMRQTSHVTGIISYCPQRTGARQLIEDSIFLLQSAFAGLGLHFIIVAYPPNKLHAFESSSFAVKMFLPSEKCYWEVGRISLCGDFISKRLHCYYDSGRKSAYFSHIMYIDAVNISRCIGIILENNQNQEGGYSIPEILKESIFF